MSSGRADAFTTTVLSSMIAKEKNPGLGTFNTPKPRAALPGYFGIRSEMDPRFKNFLNWWAEWNNKLGHNERRMKDGMLKYSGISEIPADGPPFEEVQEQMARLARLQAERLAMDRLARSLLTRPQVTIFDDQLHESWRRARRGDRRDGP